MKKIILTLTLLVLPNVVFAQWIDLSCVDPKDNFTVNYSFNEKLQKARNGNSNKLVDATIDKFGVLFQDGEYFVSIKRSTGVMNITAPSGRLLSPYYCSLAKQKF